MKETIKFRQMRAGEEAEVCSLIVRVFDSFVAPHFSEEGVAEFREYVQPKFLLRRSRADHHVLVATKGESIVGMIELRGYQHVSLLFVSEEYQGRGISRELLRRGVKICLSRRPEVQRLTVHSSPNAVRIYERMGFQSRGPEEVKNGIRYTPMVLELANVPPVKADS